MKLYNIYCVILFQLLSQLFHRILSPTSRFRYLVEMNIPDLSHIHHFPILTAAFGVLLSLIKQEMNTASCKYYN